MIKLNQEATDIVNWFEARNRELVAKGYIKSAKSGPQEVIIKPEMLDTSTLAEDSSQKALWRPSKFNEYVGQSKLKEILIGYLNGCKKLGKPFPHTMIDGK